MQKNSINFFRIGNSQAFIDENLNRSGKHQNSEIVEFVKSTSSDPHIDRIRSLYQPINVKFSKNHFTAKDKSEKQKNEIKTDVVRKEVDLQMQWMSNRKPGPGLTNLGNTCFLNSILQVLMYTPPFWNAIFTHQNVSQTCRSSFCTICEIKSIFEKANKNQTSSIRPYSIINNIRLIRSSFRSGRQEDAHELFLALLDSIEKINSKIFKTTRKKNPLDCIFSGRFSSQVECIKCGHVSETNDPMTEINVDLKRANSINESLKFFTRQEKLDDRNRYKCSSCNKFVNATKTVTIKDAPPVLVVQIKRFNYVNGFNFKIGKSIHFSEELNLSSFMTSKERVNYELYAVVVHQGSSTSCGHYYSYVRTTSGMWYEMNDEMVRSVSLNRVLQSQAYMLFYIKTTESKISHANKNANSNLFQKSQPDSPHNYLENFDKNEKSLENKHQNGFTHEKRIQITSDSPKTQSPMTQKQFYFSNKTESVTSSNDVDSFPKTQSKFRFESGNQEFNLFGSNVKGWNENSTENSIDLFHKRRKNDIEESEYLDKSPDFPETNSVGKKRKFKASSLSLSNHSTYFVSPFQTTYQKIYSNVFKKCRRKKQRNF